MLKTTIYLFLFFQTLTAICQDAATMKYITKNKIKSAMANEWQKYYFDIKGKATRYEQITAADNTFIQINYDSLQRVSSYIEGVISPLDTEKIEQFYWLSNNHLKTIVNIRKEATLVKTESIYDDSAGSFTTTRLHYFNSDTNKTFWGMKELMKYTFENKLIKTWTYSTWYPDSSYYNSDYAEYFYKKNIAIKKREVCNDRNRKNDTYITTVKDGKFILEENKSGIITTKITDNPIGPCDAFTLLSSHSFEHYYDNNLIILKYAIKNKSLKIISYYK